jgi:hypothetical protein
MMRWILAAALLALAGCNDARNRKAEEAVRYQLIDGDSAKFREVRMVGEAVCGEVNAKNRMGAYIGFEPFAFTDGTALIASDDDTAIGSLIAHSCASPAEKAAMANASSEDALIASDPALANITPEYLESEADAIEAEANAVTDAPGTR